MASTSAPMASDSSPFDLGWTYEVFLSFRGEDTRCNFTDHLYTTLVGKGIRTFRDDKLKRGEKIAPELLNAIEKSRSSIVVFSKTYAHSTWCLDELAKIMECSRKYGQIVLPIFYHVDPSDVRKQTGRFGEAFTKYEENWNNKVQSWREALTEADNLSGWHVNEGYESQYIKNITSDIADRISNCKTLFVGDNLVGMDSHFKKISLGLRMESNDVRMVGICGIGGIGKTTIVGYIYNQISSEFECSSFLEDAKKVYKKKDLSRLQKLLLNDIQKGENSKISNIRQGARVIQNSLYLRKALIVLDDVDYMDQLEFLVGNHAWYGKGSRIIITARDKQCLNRLKVDYLYEVEGLKYYEALKLFSQYALHEGRVSNSTSPNLPKEDFKFLSYRVIHYCEGVPLALKVLGSLLCGKTKGEWKSELHKLEKEPEMNIQNVLKISLDGLGTTEQMILLDIACFFQGEDKDFASKIWDGYELYGEINIRVLSERCLITISNNRLHMHGLIEKMCKKIVREQHPKDPSRWSRLWNWDDIYCAFVSEKGMENVETISLDLSRSKEKWFTTNIFARMKKVFAKMKKLRLLKVYYSLGDKHKMSLPKDFEFPPNLNYLHWEGLVSLPSNFHGEKLVAINLKSSNIKELLKGEKCLAELKFIDLSNSQQLIKIPKFSRMPKLEKLNLEGCVSFSRLHSSIGTFSEMNFLRELNFSESGIRELPISIGSLTSLETLNLSKCSKFEKFPDIFFVNMRHLKRLWLSDSGIKELPTSIECLEALEDLLLNNCSNFEKFPEIQKNMENLWNLDLSDSGIKELSCLIGHLPRIRWLTLGECKNLRSVPTSILQLESLWQCHLGDCSNLEIFPEIMEDMEHSKGLSLRESAITELPSSMCLYLSNCENLETLPNSIGMTCVNRLVVRDCPKLHKLPDSLRSMQLKQLDVSGCNLMAGAIPDDLWCLFSLEELNVSGNNIDCIPGGIIRLSRLRTLTMNNCLMLKEIPELPSSLRRIEADGCPLLETLSSDAKHPLWSSLHNCLKSQIQDCIGCPIYLLILVLKYDCVRVVIPGSRGIPEWISHKSMGDEITIDLPKNWYEDNNFLGFALFWHHVPFDDDDDDDLRESAICKAKLDLSNCENLETLPNSIGMTCFSEFVVHNCPKLHKLPDNLRSMQLQRLDVSGCNLMAGAIPDDLWCLFSLVDLNVSGNNIDCIPGGIIRLSQLHSLLMNHCLMLKEIPELPSSLRYIQAYGCPLLETLSSDAKHPLWSSLPNCLKSLIQDFQCPTCWRKYLNVRVVIPGSRGIPEWISHKSMGDEITIDLPKNWYEDNNFLGFALFWHLVLVDDYNFPIAVFDTLRLLISDGDQFGHVETTRFDLNYSLDKKNRTLRVVYFPQIVISSEYRSNRWNKFKARFSSVFFEPNREASGKVESCGIHLIYDHGQDHAQQSLQLFNVKRSHDDTEDHPHV